MTNVTVYYCDGCRRQSTGSDDFRYWHSLRLTEKDYDSIPPGAVVRKMEFCSVDCLRSFVEKLEVRGGPFARLT